MNASKVTATILKGTPFPKRQGPLMGARPIE
jgi:hypothetical protein